MAETVHSTITADTKCVNTVQGLTLIVDNFGAVCHRNDVNSNGCCQTHIDKLSCKSCNPGLQCCTSLEYCVSCCLSGVANGTSADALADSSHLVTCLKNCRTSSKSTRHGNEYLHAFKHCYTKNHDDLDKLTLPDGVSTVITANQPLVSCVEACSQHATHTVCVDGLLGKVNNCDALQEHFQCTDCKPSDGLEQPSFVVASAPSNIGPGTCNYNKGREKFNCHAKHQHTQRLCMCVLPGQEGLLSQNPL